MNDNSSHPLQGDGVNYMQSCLLNFAKISESHSYLCQRFMASVVRTTGELAEANGFQQVTCIIDELEAIPIGTLWRPLVNCTKINEVSRNGKGVTALSFMWPTCIGWPEKPYKLSRYAALLLVIPYTRWCKNANPIQSDILQRVTYFIPYGFSH